MSDYHILPSDRIISYIASGTVTSYSFNFIVWEKGGIAVYLDDGIVDTRDYEVNNLGDFSGGTVVFHDPPQTGKRVTIIGNTPRQRAADYSPYIVPTSHAMNLDHDFQEAQIQENTRQLKRALVTPPMDGIPEKPMTLPAKDDRKDSYLAFDGEGNPIALGDSANLVKGIKDTGSTPDAVMLWKDSTGLQAADSLRKFGEPNGAATLDASGKVPDAQLPPRGHSISNNGTLVPYRKDLNFSDEFVVADSDTATNVSTAIHVTELGTGVAPVKPYAGHGEIQVRTMVGKDNIALRVGAREEIEISSSYAPKEYSYDFTLDTWDANDQIVIPPAQHGLGDDGHLIVVIRAANGDDVVCNVNVATDGVVTLSTATPFDGMVMVYGGTAATAANMVNPMTAKGDIIYSQALGGMPQRLPIGSPNQVLTVSSDGVPAYRTMGTAAWPNTNIPGGAVQLDDDGEIPPSLLPINSLTYKGTFGSSTSSTGGDLPTSGVLDGDFFVADSDYFSAVAGKPFLTGQWAVYNATSWDVIPLAGGASLPTGSVIAHAGNATPQGYLPCNGYTLAKSDYPYLFAAIGTLYNSGSEDNDHFSIPNYNSERRFLQGNASPGTKTSPGLPELSGHLSNVWQRNTNPSTLSSGVFKNTTFNNSDVNAGGYNYDSFNDQQFLASRYNTIYGNSTTVQPPAQNVVFIIKYK
jgi:microcystin-dependent protein